MKLKRTGGACDDGREKAGTGMDVTVKAKQTSRTTLLSAHGMIKRKGFGNVSRTNSKAKHIVNYITNKF